MKSLIEELAQLIEQAVTKSEQIQQVAGGGTPILPRQALYIINRMRRLVDENPNPVAG